jgi:hypothetical protein
MVAGTIPSLLSDADACENFVIAACRVQEETPAPPFTI